LISDRHSRHQHPLESVAAARLFDDWLNGNRRSDHARLCRSLYGRVFCARFGLDRSRRRGWVRAYFGPLSRPDRLWGLRSGGGRLRPRGCRRRGVWSSVRLPGRARDGRRRVSACCDDRRRFGRLDGLIGHRRRRRLDRFSRRRRRRTGRWARGIQGFVSCERRNQFLRRQRCTLARYGPFQILTALDRGKLRSRYRLNPRAPFPL
jgi:hypothetical protein